MNLIGYAIPYDVHMCKPDHLLFIYLVKPPKMAI